eukprot:489058-Rhodomonas_salina.2
MRGANVAYGAVLCAVRRCSMVLCYGIAFGCAALCDIRQLHRVWFISINHIGYLLRCVISITDIRYGAIGTCPAAGSSHCIRRYLSYLLREKQLQENTIVMHFEITRANTVRIR